MMRLSHQRGRFLKRTILSVSKMDSSEGAPSSNLQVPSKFQIPNRNMPNRDGSIQEPLELGALEFLWHLELGSLEFPQSGTKYASLDAC